MLQNMSLYNVYQYAVNIESYWTHWLLIKSPRKLHIKNIYFNVFVLYLVRFRAKLTPSHRIYLKARQLFLGHRASVGIHLPNGGNPLIFHLSRKLDSKEKNGKIFHGLTVWGNTTSLWDARFVWYINKQDNVIRSGTKRGIKPKWDYVLQATLLRYGIFLLS